jgi:hypothetical protein
VAVTVTPTVEAGNDPPRIRLDVTATAGETATTVTRLDPDGTTVPVRTNDGAPLTISAGVGLVYDYEAPFSAPVTYSTVETPANVSAQVTLTAAKAWLVHPGVPALSVQVTIAAVGARTRSVVRGVHWPMGRAAPVVQTDGMRKAAESSVDLYVPDEDSRAALETLTADAGVLLFNVPATLPWGLPAAYISVGDMVETRAVRYLGQPDRTVTLPYQVVDRPVGGTQAERTLADLAGYGTLAALAAQYGTLFDVAVGP